MKRILSGASSFQNSFSEITVQHYNYTNITEYAVYTKAKTHQQVCPPVPQSPAEGSAVANV